MAIDLLVARRSRCPIYVVTGLLVAVAMVTTLIPPVQAQSNEPVEVCYDLPELQSPSLDATQQSPYDGRVQADGEPGYSLLERAYEPLQACVRFHSPEGFLDNAIALSVKGSAVEGWEEYMTAAFMMEAVEERQSSQGVSVLQQRVAAFDQCTHQPATTSKSGVGAADGSEEIFDGVELVVVCTAIDAQTSGVRVQFRFQLRPQPFELTSNGTLDTVYLSHAFGIEIHLLNWVPKEGNEMVFTYSLAWSVPTSLFDLLLLGMNRKPHYKHFGLRMDAVSDTDVESFWYDAFTFMHVDTRPTQAKPSICPAGIVALCRTMRSAYSFELSSPTSIGLDFITGWTAVVPTRVALTQEFDFSANGESSVDVHAEPAMLLQLHRGYLLDGPLPMKIVILGGAALLVVLLTLFIACCCCCCPCCPYAIDKATKDRLRMNMRYVR